MTSSQTQSTPLTASDYGDISAKPLTRRVVIIMRAMRNVCFLAVLSLMMLGRTQPAKATTWDCNWDGICDSEEMTVYYMCGDCGSTYCTNYCEEHDWYWCDTMCWGDHGGYAIGLDCDSNTGAQDCDWRCYCSPPMN